MTMRGSRDLADPSKLIADAALWVAGTAFIAALVMVPTGLGAWVGWWAGKDQH